MIADLYLSLHTDDPRTGNTPGEHEATYDGYERVRVDSPELWNGQYYTFPEAIDGSVIITYFALRSSNSGSTAIVMRDGKPLVGRVCPTIRVMPGVSASVAPRYFYKS